MKRRLSGLLKFAASIGEYPLKGYSRQDNKNNYNWEPVIQAVRDYVDKARASTSDARPSFDRLMHGISGGAYTQTNFKPQNSRSLFIGVGGYGEGEGGAGYRYFDWSRGYPNAIFLRHDDTDYLKNILNAARESNIPTTVFGHSFGASPLAKLAKDYPEVFFMASDPVSRFNFKKDSVSDNLMYHMPIKLTPTNWAGGNIISVLGGRWHPPFYHTLYYNSDGHSSGIADRELETMFAGIKRWLERGVTADQIKKNIQKNLTTMKSRHSYPYPETSKEYYDANTFKGITPPDGWKIPDAGGLPQMPSVTGTIGE